MIDLLKPTRLRVSCLAFACVLAGPALTPAGRAVAQDNPAWFVPKPAQAPAQAAAPAGRARPGPRQLARQVAGPVGEPAAVAADTRGVPADGGGEDQSEALPQYNLPALAPLPPLAKTAPPPTAIVGVLGVPDVMRASTASQAVQKVIGARRDKLAADYQKEQQVWRDLQQKLISARDKLSQPQLQAQERALQERVATETKQFRARNRVIQEAGQVSLAQIERVLVAVIRQVSESRGMNLVLHRQQVALNVAGFDITDQVTAQLNTLLPSVTIPPEGEEPTAANTGGALGGAPAAPVTAAATPARK